MSLTNTPVLLHLGSSRLLILPQCERPVAAVLVVVTILVLGTEEAEKTCGGRVLSTEFSVDSARFWKGLQTVGLSDSFYDEDSKCPKCQRRIQQGWQTKRLDSLMESWHKG